MKSCVIVLVFTVFSLFAQPHLRMKISGLSAHWQALSALSSAAGAIRTLEAPRAPPSRSACAPRRDGDGYRHLSRTGAPCDPSHRPPFDHACSGTGEFPAFSLSRFIDDRPLGFLDALVIKHPSRDPAHMASCYQDHYSLSVACTTPVFSSLCSAYCESAMP